MTYWLSCSMIRLGVGILVIGSRVAGAADCSSWMISWHRSMHSSQMYTPPGPAMSLWTCSWLLPQNEQRYCTRGVFVLAIDQCFPYSLTVAPVRRLKLNSRRGH